MKATLPSNVITVEEATRRAREIPQAWGNAVGILKGKRKTSALEYQQQIRAGGRGNGEIPAIWKKVFGMMKGKRRLDPVKAQRKMRAEAEKRLRRQVRLGRKKHVARH